VSYGIFFLLLGLWILARVSWTAARESRDEDDLDEDPETPGDT